MLTVSAGMEITQAVQFAGIDPNLLEYVRRGIVNYVPGITNSPFPIAADNLAYQNLKGKGKGKGKGQRMILPARL